MIYVFLPLIKDIVFYLSDGKTGTSTKTNKLEMLEVCNL